MSSIGLAIGESSAGIPQKGPPHDPLEFEAMSSIVGKVTMGSMVEMESNPHPYPLMLGLQISILLPSCRIIYS